MLILNYDYSVTGKANPNVLSATDTLTTVYSALYRAAQFPRLLSEIDLDNKTEVHYSAYDPKGGVHPLKTEKLKGRAARASRDPADAPEAARRRQWRTEQRQAKRARRSRARGS